jgi:nucleoside-diphosphate-sugar epimerase
MTTLLCFGFGYCAEHYLRSFGSKFDRTVGTVRSIDRAKALNETYGGRLQAVVFDGRTVTSELCRAINEADALLVSAPPDENGDPVLRVLTDELINAADLRSIVYLSTIGVYGDCGGAWVDESTEAKPGSVRGRARLAAEQAWQQLGKRRGATVAILRLAGIYGPGQNALLQVASGKARRIVKPGQIFNRIHVDDIAQAIDAAFTRGASGIFNVADDEPSPAGEPMTFAAQLLGVAPPPEISFESAAATMSPMALSFWQECRRAHNNALKRMLGVRLLYPTYREGLRALLSAQRVSAGSDL